MVKIDKVGGQVFIASAGERLDTIVYRHYGTLAVFEQVLALNPTLNPVLKNGDRIYLPILPAKQTKKAAQLW
jgi:phage tail protein X